MTISLTAEKPAELWQPPQPRFCTIPDSVSDEAGTEAIELARLAGLELDPWQQTVLRSSLGERADGKWAAATVGLVCPRQNGKNAILEARELAGLFLFGEMVIIHTAHEQGTASRQFERLTDLIEGTPELNRRKKKIIRGKGSEAIELKSGAIIFFKTRTSGGARGWSIDLIVFDEAYELPDSAISAIVPTRSAMPNAQTWYTSSAVDQQKHHHGTALSRQRERGIAGKPRIAYFEWSAEGDDPGAVPPEVAGDPAAWADANPGYGYRLTEEAISLEFDGDMGPREFAVERLGIGDWPRADGDERIIPRAEWLACGDPNSTPTGAPAFGIDGDPGRRWASIVVAAKRDDEAIHLQVVERQSGVHWLVDTCAEIQKANPDASFVVDGRGPVAPMMDALRDADIRIQEIDTRGYLWACSRFVDAVRTQGVRFMPPEPDLDDAMAGATARPVGDAWAWNRRNSSVDISSLVAATLAMWGVGQTAVPQVYSIRETVERLRKERGLN